MYIDLDPDRPAAVSSTDEQHAAAKAVAEHCRDWLHHDCGWPDPIFANSGNGWHLLYRIDLPNDKESLDACVQRAGSHRPGDQYATDQGGPVNLRTQHEFVSCTAPMPARGTPCPTGRTDWPRWSMFPRRFRWSQGKARGPCSDGCQARAGAIDQRQQQRRVQQPAGRAEMVVGPRRGFQAEGQPQQRRPHSLPVGAMPVRCFARQKQRSIGHAGPGRQTLSDMYAQLVHTAAGGKNFGTPSASRTPTITTRHTSTTAISHHAKIPR